MSNGEKQLTAWSGDFGANYIERNRATEQAIEQRRKAFSVILDHLPGTDAPDSILECGCNVGINLHALAQITDAELHALEPNQKALATMAATGVVLAERAHHGNLEKLPFDDRSIDLVFTSGVLIHVPDAALDQAISEVLRVSNRYVLALEYFSPQPQSIPYHGHDDLLFKRDYGGLYLDACPELEYVADGFFWKRVTGLDDLNWWLFRKPKS